MYENIYETMDILYIFDVYAAGYFYPFYTWTARSIFYMNCTSKKIMKIKNEIEAQYKFVKISAS